MPAFYRLLARIRFSRLPSSLRRWKFGLAGASIESSTFLSTGIRMTWPHGVTIGSHSSIEHDVFFKLDGPDIANARIVLGNHVFVGSGTEFNCSHKITVGDDSLIASGCRLVDHDHGIAPGRSIRSQPTNGNPIIIGRDCWIGANVVILKGVSIGDGAIVGAGAIVTRSLPPQSISVGAPARVRGTRG